MKAYTYYSDGGYRFFYIDGSNLREITTDDYLGLPQSAIYYCSHYGLKVVYRVLPEKKLMLAILNIPSKTQDDSGRRIPFSMLFIGVREDLDMMNKLAIVVADNLSGFERFAADLFLYGAEGKLFVDSDRLDTFVAGVSALSIPDTANSLSKVSRYNTLLIFEGASLQSSLKEYKEQFSKELLEKAVVLSKTEALAYQERMGLPVQWPLIKKQEKKEEKSLPDGVNPGKIEGVINDLQRSIEDLKIRNQEQDKEIKDNDRQISALQQQVEATQVLLAEKDKQIKALKNRLYLISGVAFLVGIIIGWFIFDLDLDKV